MAAGKFKLSFDEPQITREKLVQCIKTHVPHTLVDDPNDAMSVEKLVRGCYDGASMLDVNVVAADFPLLFSTEPEAKQKDLVNAIFSTLDKANVYIKLSAFTNWFRTRFYRYKTEFIAYTISQCGQYIKKVDMEFRMDGVFPAIHYETPVGNYTFHQKFKDIKGALVRKFPELRDGKANAKYSAPDIAEQLATVKRSDALKAVCKFMLQAQLLVDSLHVFEHMMNGHRVISRYVRGSHAYGLQKDDGSSDIDEGGVFMEPQDWINGIGHRRLQQISDETNDTVWYSFDKYIKLLVEANPNMLESLFIDDKHIIYEHPVITELKAHRDEFVTKKCFNSLIGYAISQVKKARGINKKICNPIKERLYPFDFCYAPKEQGTTPLAYWLEHRGMKQEYCGLAVLPNARDAYGLYYDWAAHVQKEWSGLASDGVDLTEILWEVWQQNKDARIPDIVAAIKRAETDYDVNAKYQFQMRYDTACMANAVRMLMFGNLETDQAITIDDIKDKIGSLKDGYYRGIVRDLKDETCELRLSSILKGDKCLCCVFYNQDAYSQHCRKWLEQVKWMKERNEERYNENVAGGQGMDLKNMMHSVRLLNMGIEIAETGKVNVDRSKIDRDYLLSIRNGKVSYKELMEYIDEKKAYLNDMLDKSSLPEAPDMDKLDKLVIRLRKKFERTTYPVVGKLFYWLYKTQNKIKHDKH